MRMQEEPSGIIPNAVHPSSVVSAWAEDNERSTFWSADEISQMMQAFTLGGRHDKLTGKLLSEQTSNKPLRRARRYWFTLDWFLGSIPGQYCALVIVAGILTSAGQVAWVCIGGTNIFPDTVMASFWISFWLIFDPGTQTGLWEEEHEKNRGVVLVTAAIISSCGFVYMLTVLGLVVESFRRLLSAWIKTKSRIAINGHVLILGWSDKTIYLLKEMIHEAADKSFEKPTVVILSPNDELEMREFLDNQKLPESQVPITRFFRSINFREGRPDDMNDLLRASVASARHIIVMGNQALTPRESDLEVVRVCLTLAALPEEVSGTVLADVRCHDLAPILQEMTMLTEDVQLSQVQAIHTRLTAHRILSLLAVKPVIGHCLVNLSCYSDGDELYCGVLPELFGKTFKEACHYEQFERTVLVGIKPQNKDLTLAPQDNTVIQPTDKLIFIAQDRGEIDPSKKEPSRCSALLSHCCSRKVADAAKNISEHKVSKALQQPMLRMRTAVGAGMFRRCDLLTGGDGDMDQVQFRTITGDLSQKKRNAGLYIILGWPDDFRDIVMVLDTFVRKGAKIHVLSEKPMEGPTGRLRDLSGPSWKPKNVELIHHIGSRTNTDLLKTLPLLEANAILVLSEYTNPECQTGAHDAKTCDASTITTSMLVLFICQGHVESEDYPLNLICEVLDPSTDRIIARLGRRNPHTQRSIRFFRSNALETGLFTMAYSEPAIFNTLVLLASPSHDAGKLMSEPVTNYIDDSEFSHHQEFGEVSYTSFWALHERIRVAKSNGILIGLYTGGRAVLGTDMDRHKQLGLARKDLVIIVAPLRKIPRVIVNAGDDSKQNSAIDPSGEVMATVKLNVSAPIDGCERVLHQTSLNFPLPLSASAAPSRGKAIIDPMAVMSEVSVGSSSPRISDIPSKAAEAKTHEECGIEDCPS